MPTHERLKFSAWLQHASDRLEEYDIRYSNDRRVITCWVADNPTRYLQSFKNICWESHGAGHPGRIRLSTERVKHNKPADERAQKHETVSKPTSVSLMACNHEKFRRGSIESFCEECATLSKSAYGDICTVKVEVFMLMERRDPAYCSGVLPLDSDTIRCGGKRMGWPSLLLDKTHKADVTPPSSPPTRGHPSAQMRPTPPKQQAQSLQPEPYVTFYFRCRPREVLLAHGIIRPRTCTSRKRTRSPSPCARSDASPRLPLKRSRSYPCSVGGSEATTKVGSPTSPYLTLSEAQSSKSGAGAYDRDRHLSDTNGIMKRAERSKLSMPLRKKVSQGVGVQTEPEGCRLCSDEYPDIDSDSDDLMIRIEQQLLETHRMLLQLKMIKRKRRRHTATRAT